MRATRASKQAKDFVKRCEADGGPVLKAYKNSAEDPVTVGYGYTGKIVDAETGEPRDMVAGDVITLEQADFFFEQDCHEAERRVDYFFSGLDLEQHQRDALFSFCFNLRWSSILNSTLRRIVLQGPQLAGNLGGWTAGHMLEWWPKYRNPRTVFEEGLYRRRLAELARFLHAVDFDIAYDEAWRAVLERDREGGILQMTNPELVIMRARTAQERRDAERVERAEPPAAPVPEPRMVPVIADPVPVAAPAPASIVLPPDWSAMTPSEQVAWLNGDSRARLTVRRKRDVVELPNVDPTAPPKDMRDSETHRGLSKAESGKEAVYIGSGAAVLTGALPLVQELTGFLAQYELRTVLAAGTVLAVTVGGLGAWRWWRGEIIAYEGRINAREPKV